MLRNILGITACALTATVASAQQPTHKASSAPAPHPGPAAATQRARVPAMVVVHAPAKTSARPEVGKQQAKAAPRKGKVAHHKGRTASTHHKAMKHTPRPDSAAARKGR